MLCSEGPCGRLRDRAIGARIFTVDDNPVVTGVLALKLEAQGHTVRVFGGGAELLAALRRVYMTLATLFVAQAVHIDLSLGQQVTILPVAMLTSKGASGVSGAGFITLAAIMQSVNPALVPGMAIILGVDKFMSECRALTNIIGNGIATLVISCSEGELDRGKLNGQLAAGAPDPADLHAAATP